MGAGGVYDGRYMPVMWPVSMWIMVLGRMTRIYEAVFEQPMAEKGRSRALKDLDSGWVC